jgi:hypothetical protein
VRDLMTGLDWKSASAPTVIHPCLKGNGSFAKTALAGQTLGKGVPCGGRPFFFCPNPMHYSAGILRQGNEYPRIGGEPLAAPENDRWFCPEGILLLPLQHDQPAVRVFFRVDALI